MSSSKGRSFWPPAFPLATSLALHFFRTIRCLRGEHNSNKAKRHLKPWKKSGTSTTLVDLWTTQQTSLEMVAMEFLETGHGKYQQNPTSSTIHEVGSLAVSTVSFQALSGLLAWDVGFALRNLGICRDFQALSVIGRHWESTSVKPPWFDTSHLFIYSLRPSSQMDPVTAQWCPVPLKRPLPLPWPAWRGTTEFNVINRNDILQQQ